MNLTIVKKQKDMKKSILIIVTLLSSLFAVYGQEKGIHLAISGNFGCNTFSYKLDKNIHSKYPHGWGTGLAAQYFFTKNWGLSLGLEWFSYNGRAVYSNSWQRDPKRYATDHMIEGHQIASSEGATFGEDYTLRLSVQKWTERQHGYVLNIPLMAQYQTKWGRKEMIGMYWAAGIKFQIPIMDQTYSIEEGALQVIKYYPNHLLTVGDKYNVPTLGLGTTDEYDFGNRYDGTMKLKGFSAAASGELGMLFNFSRRVDFAVGVYIDYGFVNIKLRDAHKSGNLIMPNVDANKDVDPAALDDAREIGDGLLYNGFLQSSAVNKVNLLAFGGKATLRIKLDKMGEKGEEQMSDREWMKAQAEDTKKQAESDRNFYKGLLQALADTIVVVNKTDRMATGEWNPENLYSPNNPNNKGYAYPAWYTPDYLNDPDFKDNAGMGSGNEGPNNPAAVKRNQEKVKQVVSDVTESIHFDKSKYDLRDQSIEVLERKIALMKKYPNLTMALIGHTCDLGSNSINDELSQNRCISARNYMIRKGIKASRIDIVPMGKHHPDYPNNTEANRELNRRVDFIVVE
jgi:outer membrane protein OmpA-like peptidoglycan-associated protein